jgi:hypothetical protein
LDTAATALVAVAMLAYLARVFWGVRAIVLAAALAVALLGLDVSRREWRSSKKRCLAAVRLLPW